MIQTKNMQIDPELCKRLDNNVYSNNPTQQAISKSKIIRTELLELIAETDQHHAEIIKDNCLFYLYSAATRTIDNKVDKNAIERGRANMQTAHNQLKNYK